MRVKKVLACLFASALLASISLAQQNPSSPAQPSADTTNKEQPGQKSDGTQQPGSTDQAKASATGEWDITIKHPSGEPIPATLSLKQDGEGVAGTATSSTVPAPLKIEDGKMAGDRLTFSVMVPDDAGAWKGSFTGTITGDRMKGIFEGRPGTMEFEGGRKKSATDAGAAPAGDKKETPQQKPLD